MADPTTDRDRARCAHLPVIRKEDIMKRLTNTPSTVTWRTLLAAGLLTIGSLVLGTPAVAERGD